MTQDLLIDPEFKAFPKLARLNRDCVITEKIDGTNACIGVTHPWRDIPHAKLPESTPSAMLPDGTTVFAQSRKRIITPGADNFGFAAWVYANAETLALLGPGYHYGEWWGSGIQRGYGLEKDDKRFSLFNPDKELETEALENIVTHVPVIHRGTFHSFSAELSLDRLRKEGSLAAPGFMDPEGIVVYHTAARQSFKVTLDNDGIPKNLARKDRPAGS